MLPAVLTFSAIASFQFIWNIPSQPCESEFGATINVTQFDIVENANQEFLGNKISLFYDLGVFPKFIKTEAGILVAVNGGIPQLGSTAMHLNKVRNDVMTKTPLDFSGLGVIDFESWRADFEQNFDQLGVYQSASEGLVLRQHPTWNTSQVRAKAATDFNDAARLFFEQTLATVQQLRPHAWWGFYHYPYCFADLKGQAVCAPSAVSGNDRTSWLYQISQVLVPSFYMQKTDVSQINDFPDRAMHIYAQIQETLRLNKQNKRPFMPYMRVTYTDGGFLDKEDLINTIGLTYDFGGSGVVIWGSSGDVNSLAKCQAMQAFLDESLGPVAIYVHNLLNRCSEVFCGDSHRCHPRIRKQRKRPFLSKLKRLGALSYLITANPALGRKIFRKEFRCVPWSAATPLLSG